MRIVGLDVGRRRIGVAVSDPTGTLARPVEVLSIAPGADAVAITGDLVQRLARDEDGLDAIVLGLPRRLDGSASEMTARVTALGDALGVRTGLPVYFQDERLSSREAESRLALRERDWRKRKARLDAAAAAVILQDYLDQIPSPEAQSPSQSPGPKSQSVGSDTPS
ncbi:MAG: Holliday junction resolvase RuvX [Acidimicrobiia bacterium]|nr:Holliday junction resolvase RuvX [Acidimicrobiia bacterium]